MAWFLIPLLQQLLCGEAGESKLTVAPAWMVLKSFICGYLGVFLTVLTGNNPSLALIVALVSVPLVVLVRPSKKIAVNVLQTFVALMLSPPVLLLIYGLWMKDLKIASQFLDDAHYYWVLYHATFLPIICLLYWPVIISVQCLIGMAR
jgi:Gaa1-like, GPI transamidase component